MVVYVLIHGSIGSGKTTFARLLANVLKKHVRCKITHFADESKHRYALKHNVDLRRLHDDRQFKEEHRIRLIEFSEDYKDSRGKQVWAKFVTETTIDWNGVVIVPDLRFKEELDHFNDKNLHYFIVHVKCNVAVKVTSLPEHLRYTENFSHKSDFTIDNSKSMVELQKEAVKLSRCLRWDLLDLQYSKM